jgi:hypothetical protein
VLDATRLRLELAERCGASCATGHTESKAEVPSSKPTAICGRSCSAKQAATSDIRRFSLKPPAFQNTSSRALTARFPNCKTLGKPSLATSTVSHDDNFHDAQRLT